MADDRSEEIRRGKSEQQTAACRVKHAGAAFARARRRKVSQKRHRRFFGNKAQVRVKRRGKSSPLAKQFARHEKPHAVQDKTEEGQPARLTSGIVASRSRDRGIGLLEKFGRDE